MRRASAIILCSVLLLVSRGSAVARGPGGPSPSEEAKALLEEGSALVYEEKPAEAREKLEAAKRLFLALGDQAGLARTFGVLGECLKLEGELTKALSASLSAQKLWGFLDRGKDRPELVRDLTNAGECLAGLGRGEEARASFSRAIAMARRCLPPDDLMIANALLGLSSSLRGEGKRAEAAEALAEVVRIYRASGLDDSVDLALALAILSSDLENSGDLEGAAGRLSEAFDVLDSLGATDLPDVPVWLNRLGNLYATLGRHRDALPYFQAAVEYSSKAVTEESVQYLENLGLCLRDLGRMEEGLARCREALDIRRERFPENRERVSGNLRAVATCLLGRGRPADALPLLREALDLAKGLDPPRPEAVAGATNDLAFCLGRLGRDSESLDLYREALAILQKTEDPDEIQRATFLGNLAYALTGLGRYDEAEPHLAEALALYRKVFPKENLDVAIGLLNLATSRMEGGRSEEALPDLERALEVLNATVDGDHPAKMWALNNLAQCRALTGDDAGAEAGYRAALRMADRLGSADAHYLAANLGLHLMFARKRPADALPFLTRAVAEVEERREEARALGEWERGAYFAHLKRTGVYDAIVRAHLELGNLSEAVRYLEQGRARSLMDLLERSRFDPVAEAARRARLRGDDEAVAAIGALARRLSDTREEVSRLTHALAEARGRGEQEEARVLSGQLGSARRAHRDALRSRAELVKDILPIASPLPTEALRAPLREEERLLLYSITEIDGLLFVLPPPGGKIESFALSWPDGSPITTETLGDEVEAFRAALRAEGRGSRGLGVPEGGERGDIEAGPRLFQALVPAAAWEEIRGLDRVFLVPHGPLHHLPFEALVVKDAETAAKRAYWLDAGPPIAYAPSGSAFAWSRRRRDEQGSVDLPYSVVALGDPVFKPAGEKPPAPPESGAFVVGVPGDTPAAHAGLRTGDVLVGYDGREVGDAKGLLAEIRRVSDAIEDGERPRAPVSLKIWRSGSEIGATAPPGTLGVRVSREAPPQAQARLLSGAREIGLERGEVLDRFGGLSPLPGTRAEVLSIYKTVTGRDYGGAPGKEGGVGVLLGEEATKSRLFELAPKARFLHLATHQLVDETDGASYSRLALTLPAFPTEEDDGFLTLLDLLEGWRDRLSACRLVVLSACETLRGAEQKDEGVFAMPVGFLFAGTPSVIASLWRVDDQSAAELMGEFYRTLSGKEGRTLAAFNAARKALRKSRPEPYHWAPFVFVGDPR